MDELFGIPWHSLDLPRLRLALLAAGDEDASWEVKGGTIETRHVAKAVCGFANATGGYLVIGAERVSGGYELVGADVRTKRRGDVETGVWISSAISQVLPLPDCQVWTARLDQRHVAVVRVAVMQDGVCALDGQVYRRVAGQTVPVKDPAEVVRMSAARSEGRGGAARLGEPPGGVYVAAIADADWRRLGVTPAATVAEHGWTAKVWRAADGELAIAVGDAAALPGVTLIAVAGPSSSGKTRTAFDAIRSCIPGGQIIALEDPRRTPELVRSGALAGLLRAQTEPTVLWLDDVERFATASSALTAPDLLGLDSSAPVIVVMTCGGKGPDLVRNADRSLLDSAVDQLMAFADRTVWTDIALSPVELNELASAGYPDEAITAIRVHGLGPYVTALPHLRRKLATARHRPSDPPFPGGKRLVEVLVDWRRAGQVGPLDASRAKAAWCARSGATAVEEGFAEAVAWSIAPVRGELALVYARGGGSLEINDALTAPGSTIGGIRSWADLVPLLERNEVSDAINAAWGAKTWDIVAACVARADEVTGAESSAPANRHRRNYRNVAAAALASHREDYAAAIALWEQVHEQRPDVAPVMFDLGLAHERLGRLEDAERWYESARLRGDGTAGIRLAGLVRRRGDHEAADDLLRHLATAGDTAAWSALGHALVARELWQEAEAAFDAAIANGCETWSALNGWAQVVVHRGGESEAIATLERLYEGGSDAAGLELATAFRRMGARERAEDVLLSMDRAGSPEAAAAVGLLYEDDGRWPEAEAAYRRADQRGSAVGARNHGEALERRMDLRGAEAAYRRASARRHIGGALYLGLLLEAQGHIADAQAAYDRAAQLTFSTRFAKVSEVQADRSDLAGASKARELEARTKPPFLRTPYPES